MPFHFPRLTFSHGLSIQLRSIVTSWLGVLPVLSAKLLLHFFLRYAFSSAPPKVHSAMDTVRENGMGGRVKAHCKSTVLIGGQQRIKADHLDVVWVKRRDLEAPSASNCIPRHGLDTTEGHATLLTLWSLENLSRSRICSLQIPAADGVEVFGGRETMEENKTKKGPISEGQSFLTRKASGRPLASGISIFNGCTNLHGWSP